MVYLGPDFPHVQGFTGPGEYALISVADTGLGMNQETGRRIFDPFFTTKEVGEGAGLGLSFVYGTIRRHKGYITVSSEPDKGTRLDVYLPAAKADIKP